MKFKEQSKNGIGVLALMFLVFMTLKLAGIGSCATWSWWWITAPLWAPVAIVVAVGLIYVLFLIIYEMCGGK
jgi:hypothetical protein